MLQVVCLCAEWCSACRAWRPVWDAVAARHPQIHWRSIDIEDEPDLMDEVGLDIETFPTVLIARGEGLYVQPDLVHQVRLDIETFPTVLIARGERALFLSAIPPQAEFLESLIVRLGREGASPQGVTPEAAALALRLFARGD